MRSDQTRDGCPPLQALVQATMVVNNSVGAAMLERSIQRMFEEIAALEGDFGDPIAEFVDFDPLSVLEDGRANSFELCGAAVGLLVNFAVAIDNSELDAALHTHAYRDLKAALKRGLLAQFPEVEGAARCASDGEGAFNAALRSVYLTHIKRSRSEQDRLGIDRPDAAD